MYIVCMYIVTCNNSCVYRRPDSGLCNVTTKQVTFNATQLITSIKEVTMLQMDGVSTLD